MNTINNFTFLPIFMLSSASSYLSDNRVCSLRLFNRDFITTLIVWVLYYTTTSNFTFSGVFVSKIVPEAITYKIIRFFIGLTGLTATLISILNLLLHVLLLARYGKVLPEDILQDVHHLQTFYHNIDHWCIIFTIISISIYSEAFVCEIQ